MKTLNIGGKDRPIAFPMNALIEFEELTGIDIISGIEMSRLKSLKSVRAIAFVGLKHGVLEQGGECDFTLFDVGNWLSFTDGNILKIFETLQDQTPSGDGVDNGINASEKKRSHGEIFEN